MELSEIRKTVIAGLGITVSLGSFILDNLGFMSGTKWVGDALTILGLVVGAATVVLTYLAPNETEKAERVAGRSVRLKGTQPIIAPLSGTPPPV